MSDKRRAAQSAFWSFVLQWARFGLNTVIFLVLARWLSLAEIGAFAVAYAPVNLLQLVQRTGFSETVVQGDADDGPQADTIFWLSTLFGVVMSLCVFGLSFVVAPLINSEASGHYLAAMAIIPALIGVAAAPEGLLRRRLEIRTLALRTTASLTIAGLLAIWLGWRGYGGWALTAFAIANALLSSVFVVLLARWTPSGGPSRAALRQVLPVLASISGRGLAVQATMPLLQVMVGAGLGPAAAGAFQIAQRFLTLAATATLTPMRFAALPVFVRVRDDAARLRRTVVGTAGLVSLISAPIYFGLLATAPLLVPLAVGETNGPPSVPVLQALLLVGGHAGLYPVFLQSLTAIGRSDVALRWSVALLVLNLAIGAVTVLFSSTLTALGYSLLGYVLAPVLLSSMRTHMGVPPREMIVAVFGPVLAAIVMAIVVLAFGRVFETSLAPLPLLAAEIALGAAIYIALVVLISRRQVTTTLDLLSTLRPRRL